MVHRRTRYVQWDLVIFLSCSSDILRSNPGSFTMMLKESQIRIMYSRGHFRDSSNTVQVLTLIILSFSSDILRSNPGDVTMMLKENQIRNSKVITIMQKESQMRTICIVEVILETVQIQFKYSHWYFLSCSSDILRSNPGASNGA